MQQLTFTNALGESVNFANAAPFVLWKVTGLEPPAVTVLKTQAPGQHGYTLEDTLLEARSVRLSGHVDGKFGGLAELYGLRRRLSEVCNPLLGPGTLKYANDAGAWTIGAFCSAGGYGGRFKSLQSLDVVFECPSPFWLSEPQNLYLSYIQGGMSFPINTPGLMGLKGYRAVAVNDGDAPAPLELFFDFSLDGGSVNPTVTNVTTGEFIRLARHVDTWNSLYINTGTLEVSLISVDPVTNEPVSQNAYGYISMDSTLFKLAKGANTLVFSSDDGSEKVKVTLRYANMYAGV